MRLPLRGRVRWAALGLVGLSLSVIACQPTLPEFGAPVTAREWLAASARAHDPEGRWPVFESAFTTEHYLPDGQFGWGEAFYVDLGRDSFARTISEQGFALEQRASPRGCTSTWSNPAPTPAERVRLGLTGDPCRVVRPRQRFNVFLLGLPMSALGGVVDERDTPRQAVIWGEPTIVVEIEFPGDTVASRWQVLIDPVDYRLRGASFAFESGGGEWLAYTAFTEVDGLSLGRVRRIYRADTTTAITEQRLHFGR